MSHDSGLAYGAARLPQMTSVHILTHINIMRAHSP